MALSYLSLLANTPKGSWNKNAGLRGPQMMAFRASGVEAQSVLIEPRIKWALYSACRETDELYVLGIANQRSQMLVPKRAFLSLTDEIAFRELLQRFLVEVHLRPPPRSGGRRGGGT
jgi:YcxB-like protein